MIADPRISPSDLLLDGRIIAVLRANHARDYRAVIDALVRSGIRSIELTMTTPGTLEELERLVRAVGADAEIGVGTVLSADIAVQALDRGARYLVTPTVLPEVVGAGRRAGRPVYPGAFTPTEVAANWAGGASAVKLFPASILGPRYLAALRGPMPEVLAIPSGGITIDATAGWLAAGAIAVSLGGELLGDVFRTGDVEGLTRRARAASDIAAGAGAGAGAGA